MDEKYRSTGDLSVNNHWTLTLSRDQKQNIFNINILEIQNDIEVPYVLKLQDSYFGSEVQKIHYDHI